MGVAGGKSMGMRFEGHPGSVGSRARHRLCGMCEREQRLLKQRLMHIVHCCN